MQLPDSIRQRLEGYCGIDYEVIGDASLGSLIRQRKAECNIASDEEYFTKLLRDDREVNCFIEGLLVPETWFFRDTNPFVHFGAFCKSFDKNRTFLRILSIACATGEEPYSIAMSLIDEGWSTDNFSVYGVDISQKFLDIARKGIYGLKSFRPQDSFDKSKHFDKIDENHYAVKDYVRDAVRFMHGNIISPTLFQETPPFHAIFARNILIYFSIEARKKSLENIDRLLAANGRLFLGHADNITCLSDKFKPSGHPSAFSFERKPVQVMNAKLTQSRAEQKRNETKNYSRITKGAYETSFLERAREFANRGLFHQAKEYINKYIETNGTSAEAYFLMGEIYAAQNKVDSAEEAYRKAIYLDNNHLKAISHLELLCRGKGDWEQAKILRDRSIRLKNSK